MHTLVHADCPLGRGVWTVGGIRLTEGKKATWYLMWLDEESWGWQTLGDLATDTVISLPLYI